MKSVFPGCFHRWTWQLSLLFLSDLDILYSLVLALLCIYTLHTQPQNNVHEFGLNPCNLVAFIVRCDVKLKSVIAQKLRFARTSKI